MHKRHPKRNAIGKTKTFEFTILPNKHFCRTFFDYDDDLWLQHIHSDMHLHITSRQSDRNLILKYVF